MKNIYLLPTDKPSRLFKDDFGKLIYSINIDQEQNHFEPQHIYITNDLTDICKKIILTTDQDLIKDGIQAIDDEFLEWFVKNPSCEKVEVNKQYSDFTVDPFVGYKIIIPTEEPKQETAVEWLYDWMDKNQYFIGNDLLQAVQQAKEMEKKDKHSEYMRGWRDGYSKGYSEEEVRLAYFQGEKDSYIKGGQTKEMEDEFIESLKNKLNK